MKTIRGKAAFATFVLGLLVSSTAGALQITKAGWPDPTFGPNGNGRTLTSYATDYDYGIQVVAQADGKYLQVGYGSEPVANAGIGYVARYLHDGTPDPSFNQTGRRIFGDAALSVTIVNAAVLNSGRILVVGHEWTAADQSQRGWIARLEPDGSLDSSFGNAGVVRVAPNGLQQAALRAIERAPDGSYVVAGHDYNENRTDVRPFVMRLDANGVPDAAFGTLGKRSINAVAPGLYVLRLAVGQNGKPVLVGYARVAGPGGTVMHAIAVRLNADGSADAGFAANGVYDYLPATATVGQFSDVNVDPNGAVLLVGYYTGPNEKTVAIRLGPNGLPDPSFGTAGKVEYVSSLRWHGIARQPGGGYIVSGFVFSGQEYAIVARWHDDGTTDQAFGNGGSFDLFSYEASQATSRPLLDADGKIVVSGKANDKVTADNAILFRLLGPEITTQVVEFYDGPLDHFFITADPNEAAAIDGGAAGPGWGRTGQTFKSGGPNRVCRFYGSPETNPATGQRRGPNSHFYTMEADECVAVKTDAGWKFESYDFNGWPLKNGSCPAGTQAIKRVYNKRFAQNDSNHRYITTDTLYQQMTALGWSGEGTVFCAVL